MSWNEQRKCSRQEPNDTGGRSISRSPFVSSQFSRCGTPIPAASPVLAKPQNLGSQAIAGKSIAPFKGPQEARVYFLGNRRILHLITTLITGRCPITAGARRAHPQATGSLWFGPPDFHRVPQNAPGLTSRASPISSPNLADAYGSYLRFISRRQCLRWACSCGRSTRNIPETRITPSRALALNLSWGPWGDR